MGNKHRPMYSHITYGVSDLRVRRARRYHRSWRLVVLCHTTGKIFRILGIPRIAIDILSIVQLITINFVLLLKQTKTRFTNVKFSQQLHVHRPSTNGVFGPHGTRRRFGLSVLIGLWRGPEAFRRVRFWAQRWNTRGMSLLGALVDCSSNFGSL